MSIIRLKSKDLGNNLGTGNCFDTLLRIIIDKVIVLTCGSVILLQVSVKSMSWFSNYQQELIKDSSENMACFLGGFAFCSLDLLSGVL